KLEFEIDRRVVEAADRVERDHEAFRRVGEGEADFELRFGDLQVPELVLDDDCHLLGIFCLQVLRDANARCAGQEGDEEMVVTRQPAGRRYFRQNLANDATKSVLSPNVVTDMILPHKVLSFLVSSHESNALCHAEAEGGKPRLMLRFAG